MAVKSKWKEMEDTLTFIERHEDWLSTNWLEISSLEEQRMRAHRHEEYLQKLREIERNRDREEDRCRCPPEDEEPRVQEGWYIPEGWNMPNGWKT